jgi:CheY-like chemotaxis protein
VFDNLLSNAIKHTPNGGRISVKVERRDQRCEVEIQDNGEGIVASLLPTIFNRFSQGDTSVTRSHGGLGLGLAIAKHLVERHEGRISAVSDGKGQGATFTVTFPLLPADSPGKCELATQTAGAAAEPAAYPLKDIRLLVVDDEPDSRYLTKILLGDQGATVETAASADEGLRDLAKFKPHLLLCDLAMPGEDGFAFLRKIRAGAAPGFEGIPAIAVSALTDNASQNHAASAGFQEFVTKPFNIRSCVTAIARVLRLPAA